jgi:DNA/RNA endonuclease G (NUC1)
MRFPRVRVPLALLVVSVVMSCTDVPSAPHSISPTSLRRSSGVTPPALVISQVYGGGGNSGATLKNDFIELFNPGGASVSLTGWSVQYASAAGTTWQVTALSGSIPPGGYYLVQEAQGTGGTAALPTPNAIGTIAMGATAGKVALSSATTALSGACPAGVVDAVSFGGTASDCGAKTTATLTNTTAALRGDAGCAYTKDLSVDFSSGAPAPRNGASPLHVCPGALPVGPLDHVVVAGSATTFVGGTTQLTATPQDANGQTVTTATTSWSSSDNTVATVDTTGLVTGVTASPSPVTVTATSTDNGITTSASVAVTVTTPSINWLDVGWNTTSLPPGFQANMFLTARTGSGGTIIPATFTVEALDPAIADVLPIPNAVMVQAIAASASKPRFKITATPVAGGTPYVFTTGASTSITVETPTTAPIADYSPNDEFGDPTPASAATPNDFLIARPQYVISYNQSRGTPNWVAYELDNRQFGAEDRCNCFTADPTLPSDKQIFTSDYTNGGFDRGHMARSADRTAANVDNAGTFYLSNIVPQQADLNQGVWAQFENALGDSAKAGRAVYIVTGPIYSSSHALVFLKNEGKVAVPDSTWKVALIGPMNGGAPFARGNVQGWDDVSGLTVMAVNMPNVAGVRNDPWQKYLTTVDRIEQSTGYDILSLLQTGFQDALEAGDRSPTAAFSFSGAQKEGSAITFDASPSTDPDLGRTDLGRTESLSYAWQFGDGTTATGQTPSHTFTNDGTFTVTLTVSDAFGWQKTLSRTVTIANVAPAVTLSATSPLSILSGDAVSVAGSFTDPGNDAPWQSVIAWGNGTSTSATQAQSGGGASITGTKSYLAVGSYTVSLTVTDNDGASGAQSLSVDVSRRPVSGTATPSSILMTDLAGDIKVTLYSDNRSNVTLLDLASVRIGNVGASAKKVQLKADVTGTNITLRFGRQALVDAGVLTPATTQLDVIGDLTTGVQIVSRVPFSVK